MIAETLFKMRIRSGKYLVSQDTKMFMLHVHVIYLK